MKATTKEWVEKAEADYRSAGREMRARKAPNFDLSCFCAEQSAEKYLKAVLTESGLPTPKIHDLTRLAKLLEKVFPELVLLQPALEALTVYAVEFRYPGSSADKDLARQAHQDSTLVREAARRLLGLRAAETKKDSHHQRKKKRGPR